MFQQFFPQVHIYATQEKIDTNPNNVPAEHFVICEGKKGFCWGNMEDEKFVVKADERYAIIVKLLKEDFNSKNHGTVHILFGNGIEGTLAISRYLLYDHKTLNKLLKKRKHYFVAFKLKRETGIIDTDSILDLTDIMFKNRISLLLVDMWAAILA